MGEEQKPTNPKCHLGIELRNIRIRKKMENKIYKKHNSLENFKKVFFLIFNETLFGLVKIIYHRFSRVSKILDDKFIFMQYWLLNPRLPLDKKAKFLKGAGVKL